MLVRPARVVAVCAVVALLAGTVGGAAADPRAEQRLSDTRERLARLATQIDTAAATADDADTALADADATLREVEAVVNDVAGAVEDQRIAVRDAERRHDHAVAEAEAVQAVFVERVTRMFKQGPELTLEVLLSSEDAEEAVARSTLLRRLAEGDQVDLERLTAVQVAADAQRAHLEDERRRLEALLVEQQQVVAEVERLRASRVLAAAAARDRLQDLHGQQDDLEEEAERLEELVRQAQEDERRRAAARRDAAARQASSSGGASSSSAGAPSAARGSSSGGTASGAGFAWPLCAPVTSEYGPRWGRIHRGIDLGARTGTSVGASKAGTVIFTGWSGGYGQLVLIDHHDGVVTAYAHLSSISVRVGQAVGRGQTIGAVGSTGNSTGPHLHFETRVNGTAVNPRQYLSGRPC